MADKQITDLNQLTTGSAADELVIYDISTTEDKKIELSDLIRDGLTSYGITPSPAEFNILNGLTAGTAELNKLDGATVTTDEINILDGVTADKDEINILDGATVTTNELNILDGVTATYDEINILSGSAISTTNLNQLVGATNRVMDVDRGMAAYAGSYSPSAATTTQLSYGGHYSITMDGACNIMMPLNRTQYMYNVCILYYTGSGQMTIVDDAADSGFIYKDGADSGSAVTLDNTGDYLMLMSPGIEAGPWSIIGGKNYTLV